MDTPTPHNGLHNTEVWWTPNHRMGEFPKPLSKVKPTLHREEANVSEAHVQEATNDQTKDPGHDVNKKA